MSKNEYPDVRTFTSSSLAETNIPRSSKLKLNKNKQMKQKADSTNQLFSTSIATYLSPIFKRNAVFVFSMATVSNGQLPDPSSYHWNIVEKGRNLWKSKSQNETWLYQIHIMTCKFLRKWAPYMKLLKKDYIILFCDITQIKKVIPES